VKAKVNRILGSIEIMSPTGGMWGLHLGYVNTFMSIKLNVGLVGNKRYSNKPTEVSSLMKWVWVRPL
jgi:hypothetical protein